MKNSFLIIVFLLMISIFLNSCACDPNHYIYTGSNPELAFLAVHSMLGSYTSRSDQLLIIEQDVHGRTLFAYECNSYLCEHVSSNKVLAVCVSQHCSEDEVSFLLNQNVKYVFLDKEQKLTIDLVKSHFSDSEIESLKNDNNWGKEFDNKSVFTMSKTYPFSRAKEISDSLHNQFGDDIVYAVMVYNKENTVCFVRKIEHLSYDVKLKEAFIVLLSDNKIENSDKNIVEIIDLNDYVDELNDVLASFLTIS